MDNLNKRIKKNNYRHFMKDSYCNCDACKYKAFFVPDEIIAQSEYNPEDDEDEEGYTD